LILGAALAGRWQVTDYLGRGDTGEVYGVRDLHGSGTFALKLFHGSPRPDLLSAFQHAARTASSVSAEGIARASDFGIDANSGRAFFVSERVNWESLDRMLRTHGPLALPQLATALEVIVKALEATHASVIRNAAPPPPGWGGTPGWVGPDGADPKAPSTPLLDVFSLGLVCFFALTRHSPYRSMLAVPVDTTRLWDEMNQRVLSWSARAHECGASLDPSMDAWFSKALAPNPAERFQSVREMLAAFPGRAGSTPTVDATVPPVDAHAAAAAQGFAAHVPQPRLAPNAAGGVSPTLPDTGQAGLGAMTGSAGMPLSTLPDFATFAPQGLQEAHAAQMAQAAAANAAASSALNTGPTPQASKKNLLPFIIGGGVLLFVIAAGASWAIFGRKDAASDAPIPEPKPQPSGTSAAPPEPAPPPAAAPATAAEAEPPPAAPEPAPPPAAAAAPAPAPAARAPQSTTKPVTTSATSTKTAKPATGTTAAKPATTAPVATAKPNTPAAVAGTRVAPVRGVSGAVRLGAGAVGASTAASNAAKPVGTHR
jgi:hypothetical protein